MHTVIGHWRTYNRVLQGLDRSLSLPPSLSISNQAIILIGNFPFDVFDFDNNYQEKKRRE